MDKEKEKLITDNLIEILNQTVDEAFPEEAPVETVARSVAKALITKASSGDVFAVSAIMDRVEGRVTQKVEMSGSVDGALEAGALELLNMIRKPTVPEKTKAKPVKH